MSNMPVAVRPTSSNVVITSEALESAAKEIDRQLHNDRQFPDLSEQLRVGAHVSFSGINDFDYPNLSSPSVGLGGMEIIKFLKMIPLPTELVEQFDHMQCNCMMGLFPEIRRAWLTVDSDIFVWNYEDGSDLAYFDGLSETILGVGLVVPKPGALQDYIKYMLCLTTPVDIVLLGVTFTPKTNVVSDDEHGEMHLQPDPLFSIPSDNVHLSCFASTLGGRLFMGGKDGCVYEIVYQARDSWFQKKCRKINHSSNALTMLMPSFLNVTFAIEDAIAQLAIDNTRNILFSRSERGVIQVFDLGADGQGMSYITHLDQENVAYKASAAIRTFDHNHFKPIVHIAPISAQESKLVHLVAITQTGARIYFSTTHARSQLGRPTGLNLLHVRMPPGYAPSSTPLRPSQIHAAFYRQGVTLMSGSETEDRDVLWGISPDPFPFQSPLKEMQVDISLEGRTWAMAEVPDMMSNLIRPSPVISDTWPYPPAVVKQHILPPRTFVVLSAQGSCLLTSYRPVEQLRQLLISSKGFDSEAVQSFFKLHKEDQACAICLVLACSMQATEQQVAEWATRAFFKYGGESQYVCQPQTRGDVVDSGMNPSGSDGSYLQGSPGQRGSPWGSFFTTITGRAAAESSATGSQGAAYATSTPHPGLGSTGRAVFRPEVMKSGKHDGLCLYISRILGPIWDGRLVEEIQQFGQQDGEQNVPVLRSRFTYEELGWFLERLAELRTWMENNMQFSGSFLDSSLPQTSMMSPGQSLLQKSHQASAEAFAAEKNAVVRLKMLVDRCFEALALWELLCEHHFELIIDRLDPAIKGQVRFLKFREIILPGQEICTALISSLMNQYLDDKTSVDAISERLRGVCPSLYSCDDAVCTKAGELLAFARRATDKHEQQRILKDSLQYYRQVTHQINLEAICAVFESVRFTEGIVELCLFAAQKRDPQGLALHFFKIDQPAGDTQGQEAFAARQYCYKIILDVLQRLLVVRQSPSQASNVPKQPGPPPVPDLNSLTPLEAEKLMEATLKMALASSDELWHMCLYSWLIENSLKERLLEIKSPHMETYLKSAVLGQAANELEMLDLLWRYYEKTKNYSAAARVLTKLAEREGSELTLERRLEYLSRAIMSAKSSNLRTSSSTEGEFLHELEEKLEVARIQLQIHEALARLQNVRQTTRVLEARQALSSRLMDITTLYGDFAEIFSLWECKLAIVHCAGHYDPTLIATLWREIINKELQDSADLSISDCTAVLSKKIVALGKIYVHSERYFPLGAIILILERCSAERNWDPNWVFTTMLDIGIPFPVLHGIYDRLFKTKDPCWQMLNKPLHILEVIYHLLTRFVDLPSLLPSYDRPAFTTTLYDACAEYLVELESICSRDPTVQSTLGKFKGLKARLQRML